MGKKHELPYVGEDMRTLHRKEEEGNYVGWGRRTVKGGEGGWKK